MPPKYGSKVKAPPKPRAPRTPKAPPKRELSEGEVEVFREQSKKSLLSEAVLLAKNREKYKEMVVIASDKLLEVALLVGKKEEALKATWAWLKAYPTDPRYEAVRTKANRVQSLLRDCFFWCHMAETMNRQQWDWITLHGPGLEEEKVVFDDALLAPGTMLWDDFVRKQLEKLLAEMGS